MGGGGGEGEVDGAGGGGGEESLDGAVGMELLPLVGDDAAVLAADGGGKLPAAFDA